MPHSDSKKLVQKPVLEVIEATKRWNVRFKIDRDIWPVYHYHPEYDIFSFLKDSGTIQISPSDPFSPFR